MTEKFEDAIPSQENGEKIHKAELKNDQWLMLEETSSGTFKILASSIDTDYELVFSKWDESVEDLNELSDYAFFGLSERLKWKDVELTPKEIKAPSLDRAIEALQHLQIASHDPADI